MKIQQAAMENSTTHGTTRDYTFLSTRMFMLFFLSIALLLNPYIIEQVFSQDHHLDKDTFKEIILFDISMLVFSFCFFFLGKGVVKYPSLRRYYLNILVLFATFFLLLFFLEVMTRALVPQATVTQILSISPKVFRSSDYLPWQLLPNASDTFSDAQGEFSTTVTINSLGLRDDDTPIDYIFEGKKKSVTQETILVMGDSTTYGFGVEQNETYAQLLEMQLPFQVLNAGYASGYSLDTYYLYLLHEGLTFKPRYVIIGLSIANDILDFSKNEWKSPLGNINSTTELPVRITSPYYAIRDHQLRVGPRDRLGNNAFFTFFKIHILQNSHSYIFFQKKLQELQRREEMTIYDVTWQPQMVLYREKMQTILHALQETTSTYNSTLVVVLIPESIQISDAVWEEKVKKTSHELRRTKPQDEITEMLQTEGIAYLDLYALFYAHQDEGIFFPKDKHPNKQGHKLIADVLASYLKKSLNLTIAL